MHTWWFIIFLGEWYLQSVGYVPVTYNCKGINKISVPRETTGFAVNLGHICITLVATFKTKPLGIYNAKKVTALSLSLKFPQKHVIRVFSIVVPYVAKFTS